MGVWEGVGVLGGEGLGRIWLIGSLVWAVLRWFGTWKGGMGWEEDGKRMRMRELFGFLSSSLSLALVLMVCFFFFHLLSSSVSFHIIFTFSFSLLSRSLSVTHEAHSSHSRFR